MKWKKLLKTIAIAGAGVAAPGPVSLAVNEIFADKDTNNDEATQLIAAAMDALEKRIAALEAKMPK